MQVYVKTSCVRVMFGKTLMICQDRAEADRLIAQAKSWQLKAYILKNKKVGTKSAQQSGDVEVLRGKAAKRRCKGV